MKTITTKGHKCLVKWLRAERKARGLNQTDVAKRLREHQSWVSKLESGERRLDVIEFLAVARAIGFDPVKMIRRLAKLGQNNTK